MRNRDEMRNNVYPKEKKPLNELEEDLKSLEEEYSHIREDWHITRGKQVLSSCRTKVLVLISIISGKVFSITAG